MASPGMAAKPETVHQILGERSRCSAGSDCDGARARRVLRLITKEVNVMMTSRELIEKAIDLELKIVSLNGSIAYLVMEKVNAAGSLSAFENANNKINTFRRDRKALIDELAEVERAITS